MTITTDPTLCEVVKRWLEHVLRRMDMSSATVITYRRVAAHVIPWGEGKNVSTLDLSDYVLSRKDAGLSARTIALELRIIGVAFRWAQAAHIIPSTVSLLVPRLKIDPKRFILNHRTPTPSEASKAIETMPRDDFRLAALLIARTGARVGEVVRLRHCDLDLHTGQIAFGASDGASKSGIRWFPLDAASIADLTPRWRRGRSPLFDFQEVSAPIQALERRLNKACDDAGIPRFTPHGLRRMVIGRLMRARVDPGTAATLTGHSVQVMLRHYQVVSDDDRKAAVVVANLGVLLDPEEPTPGP